MLPEQVYHEGCFTVPPRFDFKVLPLRSQKVTVISFIGECDTFLGDRLLCNIPRHPKKDLYNLNNTEAYIDGFYDCEQQIVYLVLNRPGWESIPTSVKESEKNVEDFFSSDDYHYLKLLYFLFIVSHFVVISSVGTNLDPDYVRKFKLIEKMRIRMHPFAARYIRKLPLPCDWLSSGRATVPRLLFLFKIPPSVARKLVKDLNVVRDLERNLGNQIFNTFFETGLVNSNATNRLFSLPGHSFVHVLLAGVYSSDLDSEPTVHDEPAQEYLQLILNDLNINSICGSTFVDMPDFVRQSDSPSKPIIKSNPADFPPPDQPEKHTFQDFLHLHVSNMLEQITNRATGFEPNTLANELPTCKAWFMACYKLYTSLMCEDTSLADITPDTKVVSSCSPSFLAQAWQQILLTVISCPTMRVSNLFSSLRSDSTLKDVNEAANPDSLRTTLNLMVDPLNRLSEMRCRAALVAAEAHYKQDLPLHYSNTYHLVKVVSAFNVFISLARGYLVIPALEHLAKRLAHLYLAGRVTCSAVSLTGHMCQHELHRLPEETTSLRDLLLRYNDDSDSEFYSGFHPSRLSAAERELKSSLDNLVPYGLLGSWRSYWIQSLLTERASADNDNDLSKSHQPDNNSDTVDQENGTDQHLTVLAHQSDVTLISACSCGRQQAERADPFNYKDANWRFYSLLARVCCYKLTDIPLAPQLLCEQGHPFCLPVEADHMLTDSFKPVADSRTKESPSVITPVAVLTRRMAKLDVDETEGRDLSQGRGLMDQSAADVGLSQPQESDVLMLSDSVMRRSNQKMLQDMKTEQDDNDDDLSAGDVLVSASSASDMSDTSPNLPSGNDDDDGTDQPLIGCRRLPSQRVGITPSETSSPNTTASYSGEAAPSSLPVRFREGVPTMDWLIGDIPRYPSWSIYALGKYFCYSHSSGLSCRGFLRNSNFLLPWDVVVGPGLCADRSGKHNRGGKHRGSRSDSDTVKLFVGFEMECPLGHRFFLAGPDRAMDGPMQSNQVRRAVHDLLNRDLPLFMPCRCQSLIQDDRNRSGIKSQYQPNWAQLTRIYLAIPAVPIRVQMQPRVRPGPAGETPIFHLGHTLDQCISGDLTEDYSDAGHIAEDDSDESEACYISHNRPNKRRFQPNTMEDATNRTRQRPGFVWLNNGFLWVLRLPFAYHDGIQLFHKPTNPEQMKEWMLLRGCIKLHV